MTTELHERMSRAHRAPQAARGGRLVLAVLLLAAAPAVGQTFTFGGFSWNQADTPDVAVALGPGAVDDANFTAHAFSSPNVTGFPTSVVAFDDSVSPGRLLGLAGSGTRAVNLPAGNNGTTARSGFQLSWTGGRKLPNQLGDDFVLYESASASTSPEGFMVQVHNADTLAWSRWYYEVPDAHQLYVGEPTEGAFATAFDLDDFGIGALQEIDAIRIANITDEDRIDPPGTEISPGVFVGAGFVLPEDLGSTSDVLPDPGPMANFETFGNSTLDPDILYVGSLIQTNVCGDTVIGIGESCDDGNVNNLDGCSAGCQLETVQSRQQRNCLKALNNAGVRVAAAQGKAAQTCLLGARRGTAPDAQTCLTADLSGRILKARNKTARTYQRACPTIPDFGQTNTTAINDAAEDEARAQTGDVFGADLGAAAFLDASNPLGAICQAATLKAVEKLTSAKRRSFLRCKRIGLDTGTITSSGGLEACLDEVLADPKGKVQLARTRLQGVITAKCAGVTQATAFPGECAAAGNLAGCIEEQVDCRVCRTFNGMDLLAKDCDDYDDSSDNSSCPD